MIFESHAHYDDEAFDEDREALLASLEHQGIERVINVCAEVENWSRTVAGLGKSFFMVNLLGIIFCIIRKVGTR